MGFRGGKLERVSTGRAFFGGKLERLSTCGLGGKLERLSTWGLGGKLERLSTCCFGGKLERLSTCLADPFAIPLRSSDPIGVAILGGGSSLPGLWPAIVVFGVGGGGVGRNFDVAETGDGAEGVDEDVVRRREKAPKKDPLAGFSFESLVVERGGGGGRGWDGSRGRGVLGGLEMGARATVAWRGRWFELVKGEGDRGSGPARRVFARPKKPVPSFFLIVLRFVGDPGAALRGSAGAIVDVVESDAWRTPFLWPACSDSDCLLVRLKKVLSEFLLFLGATCW